MAWYRGLLPALLAILPIDALNAQSVEAVVSRNAHVTTVYVRAPARLVDAIDAAPLVPEATNGTETTFAQGQRAAMAFLAAASHGIRATDASGANLPPMPMGALLHASDDPLPFADPFAASRSTAVCATPAAVLPPLEELTLYWSFSVETTDGADVAALVVPAALGASGPVLVRVHERGALAFEGALPAQPDGRIALPGPPPTVRRVSPGLALAVTGAALALSALALMLRPGHRREYP